MGEKYCDDELWPWQAGPELLLGRIPNPFGEGYPPPREAEMLAGGPAGLAATNEYLARPSDTIAGLARQSTEELRGAGGDAGARLAAVQSVTARCDNTLPLVQQQLAQSDATVERLRQAGTYPSGQLGGVMRNAERSLKSTVDRDLGDLDRAVQDGLALVEDRAKDIVATRFEAAVNRFGQVAHRHAARVYRGLVQEEPGDTVDSGGSAA